MNAPIDEKKLELMKYAAVLDCPNWVSIVNDINCIYLEREHIAELKAQIASFGIN